MMNIFHNKNYLTYTEKVLKYAFYNELSLERNNQ